MWKVWIIKYIFLFKSLILEFLYRRPFSKDKNRSGYDYDSDEDWDEEEEGERLSDNSDNEDNEEKMDDYEVDN